LNAQYGVYASIPGSEPGTYRFKVPSGSDIREIVAAYRELSEPVKSATGILASTEVGQAGAGLAQNKKAVGAVVVAANRGATDPAALFEGQPLRAGGLIQPLVLREDGAGARNLLQRIACNPNIEDCPSTPAAPSRSGCNPAIEDCPSTPSRPAPRQNPPSGQRQPGQVTCTPGVDPGCGGAPVDTRPPEPTRPPANWTRRPSGTPSTWVRPG